MVRFTNNDNHNNNNLAVDIPPDGSSCPLFLDRIAIGNVSFCGERENRRIQRKTARSKDDNQEILRANVNMHQTNSGKSPKVCFHSYFHIL